MITPRVTSCSECASIDTLLQEIDCKLAKLSGSLYNNITLMLNYPVPASVFIDLLTYRRILQYKSVNSDYAGCYSIEQIVSKVKLLTLGCKSPCPSGIFNSGSITTTSTSTTIITTTSTTTTPTITTTSTTSTTCIPNAIYSIIDGGSIMFNGTPVGLFETMESPSHSITENVSLPYWINPIEYGEWVFTKGVCVYIVNVVATTTTTTTLN